MGLVRESINRFRKAPYITNANYPQTDERLGAFTPANMSIIYELNHRLLFKEEYQHLPP